jgi:hypothetical protein
MSSAACHAAPARSLGLHLKSNMNNFRSASPVRRVATAVALCFVAHGQVTAPAPTASSDPSPYLNHLFYGTMAPGSTSLSGLTAAHVLRKRAGASLTTMITPAMLGIPSSVASSAEVLAVSYASDEFPPWSIHAPGTGGDQVHCRVEFAVEPGSGSSFSSHQVYGVDYTNSGSWPTPGGTDLGPFAVASAAGASGDQLRGLGFQQSPITPVYFTVSKDTADDLRATNISALSGIYPSQILMSPGPNQTYCSVVLDLDVLNIAAQNDEISSLMVGSQGNIVFSIRPGSPAYVNQTSYLSEPLPGSSSTAYVENMLIGWIPTAATITATAPYTTRVKGTPFWWATGTQLGIPSTDVLGDCWAGDPTEAMYNEGTLPQRNSPGNNYASTESFFVNNLDGGPMGRIFVDWNTPYELKVNPNDAGSFDVYAWGLLMSIGTFNYRHWFSTTVGLDTFMSPMDMMRPWSSTPYTDVPSIPSSHDHGAYSVVGNIDFTSTLGSNLLGTVSSTTTKWEQTFSAVGPDFATKDLIFHLFVVTIEHNNYVARVGQPVWLTFCRPLTDLW